MNRLLILELIAVWDGCLHLYWGRCHHLTKPYERDPIMPLEVIVLEIVCTVAGIAGTLGVRLLGDGYMVRCKG
jgi:hypothetical protein